MKHKNNLNTNLELIQKILDEKKTKNPFYSLRALSRDLDISQAHLSHLMLGKRKLSANHAFKIGEYLNYDDHELLQLIKSTLADFN